MPPNEMTVDEAKQTLKVESATAKLETADQKAEEAIKHSIFRENAHQPMGENQKIILNIQETTPILQDTMEAKTEESTTKISVLQTVEHASERVTIAMAEKTSLPTWGVVAIIILVFLVVFGIIFFCVRRFLKKRRTKDRSVKFHSFPFIRSRDIDQIL